MVKSNYCNRFVFKIVSVHGHGFLFFLKGFQVDPGMDQGLFAHVSRIVMQCGVSSWSCRNRWLSESFASHMNQLQAPKEFLRMELIVDHGLTPMWCAACLQPPNGSKKWSGKYFVLIMLRWLPSVGCPCWHFCSVRNVVGSWLFENNGWMCPGQQRNQKGSRW